MTSPGLSLRSAVAAASRLSAIPWRASAFSRSDTRLRNAAYSVKSPRWQRIEAAYPARVSPLRSMRRASPTTERSAWNWPNDCSSSSRAASTPSLPTRLTAML